MPAPAPHLAEAPAADLVDLGARLRARRKRLRVSATTAAEAAGMSRSTWHRVERGEPSVTIGAWLGACAALGLELQLVERRAPRARSPNARALPRAIRLADYPELRRLAWQLKGVRALPPQEALQLYERNWRHVDQAALVPLERELLGQLAARFRNGRLLV